MELYTVALSQWRKAKQREIPIYDITVKSGDPFFAPEASVLWQYKAGEVSDERYTQLYREKLDNQMQHSPKVFERFLSQSGPIAVACYCRAGKFCHRHLLADYLREVAEDNDMDLLYQGEIV